MNLRRLRSLSPLFGVALFGFALWLLQRQLANYRYADLARELGNIPRSRLLLAVGLTFVSYSVLTLYDALGVRYVRRSLSYGRIATAAIVGYGVSMTLGFPLLTGAPLRYRLYSRWGLAPGEIARIVAFYSITYWLGLLSVGGVAFLLDPPRLPEGFPVSEVWMRPLGALLLGVLATYFALAALKTRVTIRGFRVELPSLGMAVAQVAASSLDWLVAAGVMYALLPESAPSYAAFFGVYVAAQSLGHASNVPGGLGVLESVILFFLSPQVPAPQVLGALLAWRAVYYLLPLGLAVVTLAVHELRTLRRRVRGVPEPLAGLYAALEPQVLAVAAFVSGVVLLFSAATPLVPERFAALSLYLPDAVMEASHLLGALCGLGLLLVARGLQMRLSASWRVAVALLAAGIAASLLKGVDWEEALILAATLGAVLASRGRFYRGTALLDEPYTPRWLAAIALALAGTVWVGVFAYKHVGYSAALWLRFGGDADAARFLRACAVVSAALLAAWAARRLRPRRAEPRPPRPEELAAARRIAAASPHADAQLALVGDKALMFGPTRAAFLAYAVAGPSWVAMGDPVGAPGEAGELAWRFREEADRHGAWPVFYQARAECLPLYQEMALVLLQLGEEAVVRLDTFSPDDAGRRGLRRARQAAADAGAAFEVVDAAAVPALLPELKAVSDEWLARRRGGAERGFAAGRFDPAYLAGSPVAVVRVDGKIVAFASVWLGAEGTEAAVDLVRLSRAAPARVLDFLLVETMLWARARGFAAFSLGMAPLPDAQVHALGERWQRLGPLAFRLGEHFRSGERLRRYQQRFGPEWRLRYLAVPPAAPVPRVLDGIAALISGEAEPES
ncbi:MAG TPA: bifunctional lysylphosphatidylglycerol flippase/synthetase MprF [Longimicrobium sp.]|nr:bifunctional lysylphosphatidylglycerol flippase/synthetase MprF [Longimicrobium sp.]